MNLPANAREATILELADNNQEIFTIAHDAIMTNGLTIQAYADIFRYLCYDARPATDRLTYLTGSKTWRRGTKPLTDAVVLQELFRVSQIVREYVLLSWENCVFSSWLPARELQRAEKAMDTLESLERLKEILEASAAEMKAAGNAPLPAPVETDTKSSISWETPDEDDGTGFDMEGEE